MSPNLYAKGLTEADIESAFEVLERAREWADGEDPQMAGIFEDAHAFLQVYEAQCEYHGEIRDGGR